MKFSFQNVPATVKTFAPMLEDHDKTRVKTVRLWVEMNRGSDFQQALFDDGVVGLNHLESAIWDEGENKRSGISAITYDRTFYNVSLGFVENGTPRLKLDRCTINKISAKPISGKALQIKFQATCIVTDGQLDSIHDILKSSGVSLNSEERPAIEAVA